MESMNSSTRARSESDKGRGALFRRVVSMSKGILGGVFFLGLVVGGELQIVEGCGEGHKSFGRSIGEVRVRKAGSVR